MKKKCIPIARAVNSCDRFVLSFTFDEFFLNLAVSVKLW